jgi:hypothetical protein
MGLLSTSVIPCRDTETVPIDIPQKNVSKKDTDAYTLIQSNFVPNNFTPPSSWNNRLRVRIGYYVPILPSEVLED